MIIHNIFLHRDVDILPGHLTAIPQGDTVGGCVYPWRVMRVVEYLFRTESAIRRLGELK